MKKIIILCICLFFFITANGTDLNSETYSDKPEDNTAEKKMSKKEAPSIQDQNHKNNQEMQNYSDKTPDFLDF